MELHTSPLGGHSGLLKTYHRVKKEFFWERLNQIFKSLWRNVWFSNKIKLKQLRYRVYKKKVKKELDKMLEGGIIELVEESEWISHTIV